MKPATAAQRHLFADDAIRSNQAIGADFRPRMNDCGGMDLRLLVFGYLHVYPLKGPPS
jgi:hypothetical protein